MRLPVMKVLCSLPLLLIGAGRVEEAAVVRIEARSADGTLIVLSTGSHVGGGLILTCGHCCRTAGGRGAKAVAHIYSSRTLSYSRTVPITILCYDRDADAGLMRFDEPETLKSTLELAPRRHEVRVGELVRVYGWRGMGNAEQLYASREQIVSLNFFLGPDNIETTGVPIPGASGGPLVKLNDDLIIGVTSAADMTNGRGVYCGLEPIYKLIEHAARHPVERIATGASTRRSAN